jgi:hypothetical protein
MMLAGGTCGGSNARESVLLLHVLDHAVQAVVYLEEVVELCGELLGHHAVVGRSVRWTVAVWGLCGEAHDCPLR